MALAETGTVGPRNARQLLVELVLIAGCSAVMAPRLLSAQFGLLDDGTTLAIAERYAHNPAGLFDLEGARGRFRPVYWLYYVGQYPVWGKAPAGYFVVQLLAFALTTLVIFRIVRDTTGSQTAAVAGGVAFLTAGPAWENYYTLSKPEPPLVAFLAVATLCLFRALDTNAPHRARRHSYLVLSAAFTGLAYLTKETAVVMLPVSIIMALLGWAKTATRQTLRMYCLVNAFWVCCCVGLRFLTRTRAIGDGNDSFHYSLSSGQIYASAIDSLAWVARDFGYAIPLVVAATFVSRRPPCLGSAQLVVIYGGVFSAAWIAIMLPWHSSLEYYLLPVSLGMALMVGGSVYLIRAQSGRWSMPLAAAVSVSLVLAWVPLVNGYTTARVQLTVDQMNAELVQALARVTPRGGTVVADFPDDSEYVFELGVQLRDLHGRPDIRVAGSTAGGGSLSPNALVAVQRVRNWPATMPRIARGAHDLEGQYGSRLTNIWSMSRQFELNFADAQEPMCRLWRQIRAAAGLICQNPVLMFDRRQVAYGWDIYRVAG